MFWELVLVQVQQVGTGLRCEHEILLQCGKRIETKTQEVLGANSSLCRSYLGKTGTRGLFAHYLSWIGLLQQTG